jgi:hypothetical protein
VPPSLAGGLKNAKATTDRMPPADMKRSPPQNQHLYLSYLDVLDDEDRALRGDEQAPLDPLRTAYTNARASGASEEERQAAERAFRGSLFARLHAHQRSALCFSGGGIRSATFGLGILQGLAAFSKQTADSRPALLGEFDYLSTVSGGGYLGSWFSAWATRVARGDIQRLRDCTMRDFCDGPGIVMNALARSPDATFEPEPEPIRHLREYTNYLSPRVGLFSGDTWALIATVVRNMILNWLVLVPLFAAVILIPVFARQLSELTAGEVPSTTLWFLLISALAAGSLATGYIGYDLPNAGNARRPTKFFIFFSLLPMMLAAVHLSIFWAWLPRGTASAPLWDVVARGKSGITWLHFVLFGVVMHGGGMIAGIGYVMMRFHRPPRRVGLVASAAAALTGAIGGLGGLAASRLPDLDAAGRLTHPQIYSTFAFPTVMALFIVTGILLVGVTSYVTEDDDREWWARAAGWYMAVAAGWAVFAALVIYSTEVLNWLDVRISGSLSAATGITGWIAAHLGASPKTPPARDDESKKPARIPTLGVFEEYGARLILPIFLVLLTMLLAAGNAGLLHVIDMIPSGIPSVWPAFLKPLGDMTAHSMWLVAAYLVFGLIWSYFVNVNKFSLHGMYRQRLIRAYLGASNSRRKPNPFTGFDDNDNISMCSLTQYRPLHVINMTLNLVHGSNLAWQQRKAEPFSSTRLHTGSCRVGYRSSMYYGGRYKEDGKKTPISLGTAITVSGAAASPNMGYHSSPLLGIVMTLFNARLGWWLGNPRAEAAVWKCPGPRFGVRPFIDETFGLTDDNNTWIYLSDGGHFENLGLYEMVLRRCHLIVISDASADPKYRYEDLANALRKIRIDLGIPIEFATPSMPISSEGDAPSLVNKHHCAIAQVFYSAVDPGAPNGTIIYIKASMNGNEPPDVKQYAASAPPFPHQPTSDQFFDESQFESYRRLGLHIIEEICGKGTSEGETLDLEGFREKAVAYSQSAMR